MIDFDFSVLEEHRKNFKDLRKSIVARPVLPLAFLEIYPKPNRREACITADKLLSKGWKIGNAHVPTLKPPISWDVEPRSFNVHLHSWLPIQRLLIAFDMSGSYHYFQAALDIAEDWIAACPIQLAGTSITNAMATVSRDHGNGNWWYDMAIAQRLHALTYIVDVCCHNPDISDELVNAMTDHVILHHALLTLDLFYKKQTNHGFFQALHQYAAIKRLPEFDYGEYFIKMVSKRFKEMIEKQYTNDMIHCEHSPGYHYMVTVALVNAYRAGLLDYEDSLKLRQAEINLSWMVVPSGQIVTFGDTDPRNIFTKEEAEFFEESSLVSMLSGGEQPNGVKSFLESGYAFARLYAPDADQSKPQSASYLAQMAGFHSRVHKHADHLSFVWYDKGRDILIDPGRYGYIGRTEKDSDLWQQGFWYSDPKRIYCESTRAHNTIEIDGKSFLRKVKPFGSALLYAAEEKGLAVTYCETFHFRFIRHNRQLIMCPGHFLLVLDWLKDVNEVQHEYRQYFHFANEWNIYEQDGQIIGHHPGNSEASPINLRVVSLIPQASFGKVVRGQEEPELLGWLSDKANSLIPTSCFNVYQKSAEHAPFATLFVFGKTLEIDWQKARFNSTLSVGRVAWRDDIGEHTLEVKKRVELQKRDKCELEA